MAMLIGKSMKPVIYFAGKISSKDWRSEIFGHRTGGLFDEGYETRHLSNLFDPYYREDYGKFFYGGPYFISCDHSCSHTGNLHGAGPSCMEENNDSIDVRRSKIWNVNKERLTKADIIFTYINEVNCFGTLIELGMAQMKKKPIVLCFGPSLSNEIIDDMWMTWQKATAIFVGKPKDVWQDFAKAFKLEEAA